MFGAKLFMCGSVQIGLFSQKYEYHEKESVANLVTDKVNWRQLSAKEIADEVVDVIS